MDVDPRHLSIILFTFRSIFASPVLDLLAEDPLDKVEHGVDKGGKVDVVDPLVPHGNALLAHVDHPPQLKSTMSKF